MREKIRQLVWDFDDRLGVDYEGLAGDILNEVAQEIKKVENKWLNQDIVSEGDYAVMCYNREKGFEECRQKILRILND